jgi:hypothetical protein
MSQSAGTTKDILNSTESDLSDVFHNTQENIILDGELAQDDTTKTTTHQKNRDSTSESQNTSENFSLPAISTEICPEGKIRIERKFIYPIRYNKRKPRSISTNEHPTTIRKKKGKRLALELIGMGMTFPSAVAFIMFKMGYKSRTTVYKWLEDPEFKEDVICAESANIGILEVMEMQAAKGGQLIRETIEKENRVGKTYSKIRSYISRRWATPSVSVLIYALKRRSERLRKIDKLSREYEESMGLE